jgi:MFS family permease
VLFWNVFLEVSLQLINFVPRTRRVLAEYAANLSSFRPNARLYLLSVVLTGAAGGVFRLLFNFYVLSLGYDQAFLGNLVTASSMTALIMALPMGYVADLLGRKKSLLIGGLSLPLAVLAMVIWPFGWVFIVMNVLVGLGQSLSGVTMGPFLMENSSDKERSYLFSFSSGLQMASAFAGNWVGGNLPSWVSGSAQVAATDSTAYGLSLIVVVAGAILASAPLLFMRMPKLPKSQRSVFAPFAYFASHRSLLGRLVLPMLVTSIGAGLIMPFMNIFFRTVHNQSDAAIGAMFAWGSLAMGAGLMLAPPLADRYGKIKLVVITQSLSIPFLALLGFSPEFALSAGAYYVRLALMNMSGPVYQTFVMEKVEPSARATVASLVSMSNSFGWAFSPTLSGWIQVNYGFAPAFGVTIVAYVLSISLYYGFFWPRKEKNTPELESFPHLPRKIL